MSSVDTRYKEVWGYAQQYNRTKSDMWLDMIENCTYSDDPVEVIAANRLLARYKKDPHVSHTG